MSHYDRDAEIAAFILTKGVTRCPTACVLPTQGSPELDSPLEGDGFEPSVPREGNYAARLSPDRGSQVCT